MSDSKILDKLNEYYNKGTEADKEIYAESRSNILLYAGDHYSKKTYKYFDRLRDSKDLSTEQRIRLTKNHTHKIVNSLVNNLVSVAPGVAIMPSNENELKDQKAAELHKYIWDGVKEIHSINTMLIKHVFDIYLTGETFILITWDWDKLANSYKSGSTGDLCFEKIMGTNVFRPLGIQSLDEAPWIGIRKMMDYDILSSMPFIKDDAKKLKAISPSDKTTYMVYDADKAKYADQEDGFVLVKQIYYRPSKQYPKGYFYFWVDDVILIEGELPDGIFPIAYCGGDEVPTHPRHRSPIKPIKSCQVELNRMASSMAEHQITIGDDKIVIPQGSKMSAAGNAPGLRAYSTTGPAPTVIPGRIGDQYMAPYNATVAEMYALVSLSEELEDKPASQVDPYALLLQSARWKKRYSLLLQKYETFLKQIVMITFNTLRYFAPEEYLVSLVGAPERVNLPEFKAIGPIYYKIKLAEQTEDLESRIGKKLSIDRYLQYAGQNLQKEDLGKFIRLDPYLNKEQMLGDFTLNYDIATNLLLSLDRGEQPYIGESDDAGYMIKKISHRISQADFRFLPPMVQKSYHTVLMQYEQINATQIQKEQALKDGFIPSNSMLVTCDMYQPDSKDPTKQVRVRLPYDALQWLITRLNSQGATQEMLNQQQGKVVSDLADQIGRNGQASQQQIGMSKEAPQQLQPQGVN